MTSSRLSPADWARQNLFRSVGDSILTVIFGLALAFLAYRVFTFIFTKDWEIVRVNMRNFLVGPEVRGDDVWGVVIGLMILAASIGLFVGVLSRRQSLAHETSMLDPFRIADWRPLVVRFVDRMWPLIVLVALMLLLTGSLEGLGVVLGALVLAVVGRGIGGRLPDRAYLWVTLWMIAAPVVAVLIIHLFFIDWSNWGGFLLVSFAGAAGIALSFPFGVLLALGRQSDLPVIKGLSVAYIEFVRGVPLVVFILMGSLLIGLFLPRGVLPSELIRAIIVLILFTAAYVAEIVRGGLQSLPPGQEEAAKAVGLPAWRTMSFIVMPQALRNVIPAMVGQAISLWKDTSLLFIIGFSEPLRLATAFTRQPEFRGQGLVVVTLFFAGLIYWVVSFTMSRESQRLEKKLGVGER